MLFWVDECLTRKVISTMLVLYSYELIYCLRMPVSSENELCDGSVHDCGEEVEFPTMSILWLPLNRSFRNWIVGIWRQRRGGRNTEKELALACGLRRHRFSFNTESNLLEQWASKARLQPRSRFISYFTAKVIYVLCTFIYEGLENVQYNDSNCNPSLGMDWCKVEMGVSKDFNKIVRSSGSRDLARRNNWVLCSEG